MLRERRRCRDAMGALSMSRANCTVRDDRRRRPPTADGVPTTSAPLQSSSVRRPTAEPFAGEDGRIGPRSRLSMRLTSSASGLASIMEEHANTRRPVGNSTPPMNVPMPRTPPHSVPNAPYMTGHTPYSAASSTAPLPHIAAAAPPPRAPSLRTRTLAREMLSFWAGSTPHSRIAKPLGLLRHRACHWRARRLPTALQRWREWAAARSARLTSFFSEVHARRRRASALYATMVRWRVAANVQLAKTNVARLEAALAHATVVRSVAYVVQTWRATGARRALRRGLHLRAGIAARRRASPARSRRGRRRRRSSPGGAPRPTRPRDG